MAKRQRKGDQTFQASPSEEELSHMKTHTPDFLNFLRLFQEREEQWRQEKVVREEQRRHEEAAREATRGGGSRGEASNSTLVYDASKRKEGVRRCQTTRDC